MAVLTISIDLTKMNSKSTVWVGTENLSSENGLNVP